MTLSEMDVHEAIDNDREVARRFYSYIEAMVNEPPRMSERADNRYDRRLSAMWGEVVEAITDYRERI